MRLREDTTYLKFTTYHDLLDPGDHEVLISRVEALAGARYTSFRDLGGTRLPVRALEGRREELLGAHTGGGIHQTTRFQLTTTSEDLGAFELTAGLHPYSGVYATHVDIRFGNAWVADHVDDLTALATWCIERFRPFQLHVHDVDDDAMQNIDNPRLLELGYGVKSSCTLEDRPGREAVRGQFRFCSAWLTYVGDEALAILPDRAESIADPAPDVLAGGLLYRLGDTPSDASTQAFRRRQQDLRDHLGVDALIERDRRAHAYWKKKP